MAWQHAGAGAAGGCGAWEPKRRRAAQAGPGAERRRLGWCGASRRAGGVGARELARLGRPRLGTVVARRGAEWLAGAGRWRERAGSGWLQAAARVGASGSGVLARAGSRRQLGRALAERNARAAWRACGRSSALAACADGSRCRCASPGAESRRELAARALARCRWSSTRQEALERAAQAALEHAGVRRGV
jgi:hypothetical protein